MKLRNIVFSFLMSFLFAVFVAGCSNKNNTDTVAEASSAQKIESIPEPKPEPIKPIDRTLLSKLKADKDDMRELTFYTHKSGPVHLHDDVYLYIVDDGKDLSLRFYLKYYGDDWLFVKKAWTKIDGQAADLPTEENWNRDNASGDVWEISDKWLSDSNALLIKKFASSENPTIRFEGDKYYKDFKPSRKRLDAMLEVIKAYEAAKGVEIK